METDASQPKSDSLIKPGRELAVDALRGFIMVLMVFGHVWDGVHRAQPFASEAIFRVVYDWIYFFHMPALFVVSGMLYRRKTAAGSTMQGLMVSAFRALYPLLLWSYVYFATKYALNDFVNRPVDISSVLWAPFPPQELFWFLWALFLIQLFYNGIFLVLRPNPANLAILLVLAVAASFLLRYSGWWSPWYSGAIHNAQYFLAGTLLSYVAFPPRIRTSGLVSSLVLFAVCPTVFVMSSGALGTTGELLLRYICIAALIFSFHALVRMDDVLPGMAPLAALGKVSLAIYMLHVFATSGTRILLTALDVDSVAVHILLATVMGLLGPFAVFHIGRRLGINGILGLGR